MMAWLAVGGFVLLACAILALANRRMPIMMFAALGLFAVSGYIMVGQPQLASAPKAKAPEPRFDPNASGQVTLRFADRYGSSGRWMAMADSFAKRGKYKDAAGLVRAGLRDNPNDPVLWVLLGNLLEQYSGNADAPAAKLAYDRARALNPDAPALLFTDGVRAINRADLPAADAAWSRLLAVAPPNAAWRPEVEQLLALVKLEERKAATAVPAGAQGQSPPAAAPPAPAP